MSSRNNAPEANGKRIAKNTLFLYFRMLLTMGVSFYTVRVVLDTLGVVDYGIYNVVGGVVAMLSFINSTLSTASQRYLSFEIGKGGADKLKLTFSTLMSIYILVGIIIVLLLETVGVWMLNNKMTIPADRMDSARWVYQFSVLSFLITMFTVPYNAAIIAHEDMKVFALVSIIEALLKLGVVYLLLLFSVDKLKLYGLLIFLVTLLVSVVYHIYCRRKYEECRYRMAWDKNMFKEIAAYSGWNLFGAFAGVSNNHGINLVLNVFFGPVVNAARGIAAQINMALNQFVQNFLVASRPQITKYYAQGEIGSMIKLVKQTSKYSFFLLAIISMPVLVETNFVLSIWLKEVPEYTILFTQLILFNTLIDCFSYPLMAAAQATGKIKVYQMVVGGMMILNLPVAYFLLQAGWAPESVFWSSIVNSVVCLLLRLAFLKKLIDLPVYSFLLTFLRCALCFGIAYLCALFIKEYITIVYFPEIVRCCISFALLCLLIGTIGITAKERNMLKGYVKSKRQKR